MNDYIKSSVNSFYHDFQVKCEVHNVIQDMIGDIEVWKCENELLRSNQSLSIAEHFNKKLIEKIRRLEAKNRSVNAELSELRSKAGEIRDLFVSDVEKLLSESKKVKRVQDRMLEMGISDLAKLVNDDEESEETEEAPENEKQPTDQPVVPNIEPTAVVVSAPPAKILPPKVPFTNVLYEMSTESFLQGLGFLDVEDIKVLGEVNRYMCYYMGEIFEDPSQYVQPGWENKTPAKPSANSGNTAKNAGSAAVPTASAVPAVAPGVAVANRTATTTADIVPIPRELLIELPKKLTPAELKVFLGTMEQMKKKAEMVKVLTEEKEDLTASLRSVESERDLLIEQLKTAEMAIMSTMNENTVLKKQATADREIISYLDMQVQDLEGEKTDCINRCNHLQASLDLQVGSHSHKEHQLSMELNEYKLNFEKISTRSKTERKILSNEVKALRKEVETLTSERDVHAYQLQLLRDAFSVTATKISAVSKHNV